MNLFHNLRSIPVFFTGIFILSSTPVYAGVLSFYNPTKYKDQSALHSEIQSFIANDAIELKELFDDWNSDLHSRNGENVALYDARFDLGVSYKQWGYLGYTYRQQADLRASEDAIELIYLTKNKKDLPLNTNFKVDLEIEGFEAYGIVYGNSVGVYQDEKQSLILGFAMELLKGQRIQHGQLNGTANSIGAKDYDYEASADYYYTHNYLYDLDVDRAYGKGYSTHFSIQYQYENLLISLIGNDVYGKIEWKNLPFSHIDLASNNKTYDDNGYVIYKPAVSGLEKYSEYSQRLAQKWRMESKYTFKNDLALTVGSDYMKNIYLPYTEIEKLLIKDLTVSMSYETRFKSLGLGLKYNQFMIGLKSDSFTRPSALGITMGIACVF